MLNIQDIKAFVKVHRNFNAEKYLDDKTKALIEFFNRNHLDSIVVGISGGIDSAVVLSLMYRVMTTVNSPLKKIVPLLMPISDVSGVSGQEEALSNGEIVARKVGIPYHTIQLNRAYVSILGHSNYEVENQYLNGTQLEYKKIWAEGQMASVLRTPVLYYHAALLQIEGYKSIVCGTTNRDEGSYIGFFGKASDGMVDLQPIADLHKSEVIELAKLLNVPQQIIDATPKGDVWDEKNDEEMIGAPYWFLETYLNLKCMNRLELLDRSNNNDWLITDEWIKNIEQLHKTNEHKYQVGSPAHFIDVMERKIPGGWQ